MARDGFRVGWTSPVYECRCCTRRTRATNSGNASCELCPQCDERCMIENGLSDGNYRTQAEYDKAVTVCEKLALAAIKKGGILPTPNPQWWSYRPT